MQNVLSQTGAIVSAYVANNPVPAAEVPKLITSIHTQLASLAAGGETLEPKTPAVPIKKSVTPAYLVCLEDGKRLKMLKRYIRTRYSLSPDDYRKRWGLPASYPMVAADYAAQRSEFAKKIGLGRPANKRKR